MNAIPVTVSNTRLGLFSQGSGTLTLNGDHWVNNLRANYRKNDCSFTHNVGGHRTLVAVIDCHTPLNLSHLDPWL